MDDSPYRVPAQDSVPGRWSGIPVETGRSLRAGAVLTVLGLILVVVNLQNAVSSIGNQHKFAHGVHAAAVVTQLQQVKGLYASISLSYTADGRAFDSAVQDPNAVEKHLEIGQRVDAVYLPADPAKVSIAGQYDGGFQGGSIVFGLIGLVPLAGGVALLTSGVRSLRR